MDLDIRQPMGVLFLILGLVLVGCGFAVDPVTHAGRHLPLNLNLWWGLAMCAFGALNLVLAGLARRR